RHTPDFTAGKRDLRPIGFAGHQGCVGTGTAAAGSTPPGSHFDRMNLHTQRNPAQREAVSHIRRSIGAILDRLSFLQPVGSENVSLFSVGEVQQRDAGAAVWIVLDRSDDGRYAVLVADEVDHSILPLVTAATMAGRDPALVVAAPLLALGTQERFFGPSAGRQFGEIADACPAAACGDRVVLFDAHKIVSQSRL